MQVVRVVSLSLALLVLPLSMAGADEESDPAALRERLEALERRVRALEAEVARLRGPSQVGVLRAALERASAVADVRAVLDRHALTTLGAYHAAMDRLRGMGPEARPLLLEVARQCVDGPGYNDADARTVLGYRLFQHDLSAIAYREILFLQEVELANKTKWFGPDQDDAYERALAAAKEARTHAERLAEDHVYRAADQLRSHLALRHDLRAFDLITHWAEPFLVCQVVGRPRNGIGESVGTSLRERHERRRALTAQYAPSLAARGEHYQSIYRRLLEMGEPFGWKPLMAPWGGLPELPLGRRSFPDGCPQAVGVFADDQTFRQFTNQVARAQIDAAGTVSEGDYLAVLAREPEARAAAEIRMLEGASVARHLLRAFSKQHARWRSVPARRGAFELGLSQYVSSIVAGGAWAETVAGAPAGLVSEIQDLASRLERVGKPYPIMPLDVMIQFTSPSQVGNWAARTWQVSPAVGRVLFQQQALVFTLLMLESDDWRDDYLTFLAGYFGGLGSGRNAAERAFRKTFDVYEAEDLDGLQAAYAGFIERMLGAESK